MYFNKFNNGDLLTTIIKGFYLPPKDSQLVIETRFRIFWKSSTQQTPKFERALPKKICEGDIIA